MAKNRSNIPPRRRSSAARRRTITRRPPAATLQKLLSAVEKSPEDVNVRLALGTYYLHNGRHNDISDVLTPVQGNYPFEKDRVNKQFDRLLAFGALAAKDWPIVIDVALRALQYAGDDSDYWYVLCLAHDAMSEWPEAVEAGRKYLQYRDGIGPQGELGDYFAVTERHQTNILIAIGNACANQGNAPEAVIWLKNAVDNSPADQRPYLHLAKLLTKIDRNEQARDVLQRGIQACPDNTELTMLSETFGPAPTISVCMIVKNEEDQLDRCLNSVRSWVDEIIVVDTGSTDRTKEIAESYLAKIFDQPWEGDFSKHRNYSLQQATGDWILILDADEEFVEEDISALTAVLKNPDHQVVAVNVFNLYDGRALTFLPSIRLFRRDLKLRYQGIVHNQLVIPSDQPVVRSECRILHHGYGLDPDKMLQKEQRTRELLDKQLTENPDDPFALFNYAQLLRCQPGDFRTEHASKILACSRRVLELVDPKDRSQRHLRLMCLNHIAWTQFYLENFEAAEKTLQEVLSIRVDYLDPLFLLGNLHLRQGRVVEGISAFETYLQAQERYDPDREQENLILLHVDSRIAAHYGIAILAHADNDFKKASEHYLKIIEEEPGYLDAACRLGHIFLHTGHIAEARSCFELQIQYGEPSVSAVLGLVHVHRQEGRIESAEECLKAAEDEFPGDVTVQLTKLRFLTELGRNDEAEDLLSSITTQAETEPASRCEVASTLFELEQYDEAARLLRAELISGTPSAAVYNDLGTCLFKQGDIEQARQCFEEALEINPQEASALRNLGVVLLDQGDTSGALERLKQAYAQAPHMLDVAKLIADLQIKQGNYALAVPMLEEVAAGKPPSAEALYSLAECYRAMGQKDAAIVGLQGALRLNPEFEPARRRLEDLESRSDLTK